MVKKIHKPCILCGNCSSEEHMQFDAHRTLKCNICGLISSDMTFEENGFDEYYNEYDFSYLLKYEEQSFLRAETILKKVLKYGRKGKLLDVGSGLGFFMHSADEMGWKCTGVELSSGAAEYSLKRFGLDVINRGINEANLKDDSYSLISMIHVLEHLIDPIDVLTQLKPKLKENGTLLIVVPNAKSAMAKLARNRWRCLAERTHIYHFSTETLVKTLIKSGFYVLNIHSMQWSAIDLLWALKTFLKGSKLITNEKPHTPILKNEICSNNSLKLRQNLNRMNKPINALVGFSGFGEEIVAMCRVIR